VPVCACVVPQRRVRPAQSAHAQHRLGVQPCAGPRPTVSVRRLNCNNKTRRWTGVCAQDKHGGWQRYSRVGSELRAPGSGCACAWAFAVFDLRRADNKYDRQTKFGLGALARCGAGGDAGHAGGRFGLAGLRRRRQKAERKRTGDCPSGGGRGLVPPAAWLAPYLSPPRRQTTGC
jgi:hypothetical protein